MTKDVWPEATKAILETMWGAGVGAQKIADELNRRTGLGFTRNAVVGKARRMKLSGRKSPIIRLPEDERDVRKIKREKERAARRRQLNLFAGRAAPNAQPSLSTRVPPKTPTVTVSDAVRPKPRTVPQEGGTTTLAEAKPHQCRFIAGPNLGGATLVCGQPVATPGLSWCRAHTERCFQKRAEVQAAVPQWSMTRVNAA